VGWQRFRVAHRHRAGSLMPLYIPAAASSGINTAAPAVSGRVYRFSANLGQTSTASALGRMHGRPVWLTAGTLDRLYIRHIATTAASEVVRLGIYSDTDNRPGALLLDAGTIDLSTATAVKALTISQAVSTARYWLAAVRQGPTSTATINSLTGNSSTVPLEAAPGWAELRPDNPPTSITDRVAASVYVTGVTGALPNPFGSPSWNDVEDVPLVAWRYA
jgi:hypothetical protein